MKRLVGEVRGGSDPKWVVMLGLDPSIQRERVKSLVLDPRLKAEDGEDRVFRARDIPTLFGGLSQ